MLRFLNCESKELSGAHADQNGAPKKAIPWVFCVICIARVEKDRPLVTANNQFSTSKFLFCSEQNHIN